MPRQLIVALTVMICMLWSMEPSAQTGISTINVTNVTGTSFTTNVTSPSDAGNNILDNTNYDVRYGQGNSVKVSSYVVSGTTYDRFLSPDTLILNRRLASDRLVNIWYQLNAINTGPAPDQLDVNPDITAEADAIYLSGNLNAGYDNILVNEDDLASNSIEVETERVDVIWYSGIQTSVPGTAVFPVIERGGNDNIAIAAITSLNMDGTPASYGTLVGIGETDWPNTGQTYTNYLILRRQTVGEDPIPILNIGSIAGQGSQTVQGMAVSFTELGISANQSIFGYSLFAADVVSGYTSGTDLTTGAGTIAAGVDLTDISTFPTSSLSSDSGLDLVAGVSAAVASDDNLIETVGPGGYKSALATWLKANDGAFVTSGGAASTEGSAVGFWEDQSVGNHDFTTLGTAPTFRETTSDINFNPTVDFLTGSETGLQLPDNADYNTGGPYTRKGLNIAFRTSTTDITTRQQLFEEGGGTNGLGIYIEGSTLYGSIWNRGNSGSSGAPWNDGTPTSFISTSVAANTEYILTMEYDGNSGITGTITFYLNGQSFGSLSSAGLLYNHGNDIGLGDQDGGSRYHNNTTAASSMQGEISEFIYCNEPGSFPLSQRNRIESYLAVKYGITLDQSSPYDYVNAAGTIIFDATNNAAIGGYLEYNNDIAGIGRDDDSELDQRQSRSENTGSVVTMGKSVTMATDDTWLLWGNDGAALTQTSALTKPDTIDQRLNRVWRVAERNEAQSHSVSFDLTGLGLSTSASDFSLLVASNSSNADFSNATVITGGTFNGNTITFDGVNLDDGEYFTLGTEFFFCTPGNNDDGIVMWLRADEGVTTATEGASVTAWDDQTPSNNDASNLTAPVYRATTALINDNPTIDFTTGSTGLVIANAGPFNVDQSISKKFTIAFRTESDITTKQVIYEQGGATRGINLYIRSGILHLSAWNQASDGVGAPWNTAGAINTVNTPIEINTTYLVTFDYAGNDAITGSVTGYLNGESFGTPLSSIGRLYGHTDPIGLGDENSASRYDDGTTSGAASFDGFISEISYYDSPTTYTATERNRIETSMAIKYGITLDQTVATNYTRSDGTTIWDATVYAAYNNDIAGIGRDDQSCLNQKQSKSENPGSIVKMGLGTIESSNAANTNAFTEDGDFLVWGSDGDFANQTNANTSDVPAIVTERIERIWRVDDTGNVGATSISFDLTGLGYGTSISDFQLIVSNSATMASGVTTPAASYDLGTNTVTFTGINLTDGQYFTLGTVRTTPCGPGGVVNGLRLQLKGDLGVTGTTNVTQWDDQSGNGFNATATTGPELLTTDINFNPALQFNGSNEEMVVTNGIFGTSTFNDVFVYVVNQTNTVQNSSVFFETTAGGERFNTHMPWSDNNIYYDYGLCCGIGRINANWGTTTGSYHFWTLGASTGTSTPSGTNKAIYRDGAVLTTNNNSDASTGANNNLSIGSAGGSNFHAGDIAEMIVFTSVPTALEKERIETYLAIKYGLFKNSADNGSTGGTDERDYFDSNSNVIWDYSINTTYHNDVAGIGRDDESCLNQKQSGSQNTDDILSVGLGAVALSNASNLNSFNDNLDFLVWGNDDGATAQASANTGDVPATIAERMTRIWKVQDNGTVGATELEFDLTGLGYSLGDPTAFNLLVGNTATMADATIIGGGTINGNVLSFSGIDLTDGQFFTIGTAVETCGPGGVNTGVALWLRADEEVYSDAGSTLAVDGNDVQQWNDQSSPADNGSEIDLGGFNPVEPTFQTNEINFNPVLRYSDPNSSNASYIETGSNNVSQDMTLIAVFQTGQASGTANDFVNSPALIGASETSSTLDYGLGMENGNLFFNGNTSTVFDVESPATYNDNNPHFVTATRVDLTGAITLYVDSEQVDTGTGTTNDLTAPTSFGIGNHSDGDVDAQFAGDIAEAIVFSSALTANERTRVESYLAVKYGLTRVVASLPAAEQDYLASDGGIIWDYDGQSTTYYNDIFGIGRDDLSCFDQRQSKSENADALVTFNLPGGFGSNDSFILSGNDNAAIEQEGNSERPASINSRLNREWRVQETGTVGSIELTYDLSTITGPLGVGTNNLNLLRLLVDDDGDFNSGATLITPSSIDGTANTATFSVDFTNGQYYTLGSLEVGALPVTLVSFTAANENDERVRVEWISAEEVGNAFYTIERSQDAINFEAIGTREGAGNSQDIRRYEFLDNDPLEGRAYYRLKQTDFNGEFEYSEVVSVTVNPTQTEFSYALYPNPVSKDGNLTIEQIGAGTTDLLTYEIVSISGRKIMHGQAQLENRKVNLTPRNDLRHGVYLIRIKGADTPPQTLRFIIR